MSLNYELLRNLYPEWESQTNPLLYMVIIFLSIAVFLIIPYIFVNFIEVKLITLLKEIWWKISFYAGKIPRIR